MSRWFTIGHVIHAAIILLAAVGFFRFWVRTRFWFPRYVHVMAVVALAIGIWFVTILPAAAPIERSEYRTLIQALIIFLFPAIVYVVFVFYGGQHAAYNSRLARRGRPCPHCGGATVLQGAACPSCGQQAH